MQRLTQALDQSLLGDRAIPELAALVVDDDPDDRSEPIEHALTLPRPERARRRHVEAQARRVSPILFACWPPGPPDVVNRTSSSRRGIRTDRVTGITSSSTRVIVTRPRSPTVPGMGDIKLGYNTGYWSAGPPAGALEAIKEAERLGFDSVWTAEAYGSDAVTPLAWWGAHTERIKLGTAIMQMSARTPAATAMAAMSLDHLSGGRFILGLGASGPQVVEGWYGEPYPKPLARTREYVEIVRRIVARDAPVEFHGEHYDLPLQGGTGLGKALKSTIHPLRPTIPIYLAAEGPKNVALAAEICDGWLPLFFSPSEDKFYRERLAEGFAASRRSVARRQRSRSRRP